MKLFKKINFLQYTIIKKKFFYSIQLLNRQFFLIYEIILKKNKDNQIVY